jgi:hypothetical protein
MIALSWTLDLPRATDAGALRSTGSALGSALGESDGLLAGIVGVTGAGIDGAAHTSIALLSVWSNSSRLSRFLWSDAMATFERELARPSGRLWAVSSVQLDRTRLAKATHCGLTVTHTPPDAPLAARVDAHRAAVDRALAGRSCALACRGLDAATWDEASLDAWTGRPRAYDGKVFEVVAAVASSSAP